MNLNDFIRLVIMAIFQNTLAYSNNINYKNVFFSIPKIYCLDGFNFEICIHKASNSISENGKALGYEWKSVYFCNLSEEVSELNTFKYINSSSGEAPIDILQQVIDSHGGLDIKKITSLNKFEEFVYGL